MSSTSSYLPDGTSFLVFDSAGRAIEQVVTKAAKSCRMVIMSGTLHPQSQVSGKSTLSQERFATKPTGKPAGRVFSIGTRDTSEEPIK